MRPQHQGAAGAARSAAYAPRQAARVDAGAWARDRDRNQRQLHELAERRSGVLWQLRPPRKVAPVWLRHLSLRDIVRCSAVCREWRSCVLETQELWKTLDLTVEAQSEFEQRLARQLEIQVALSGRGPAGSIPLYARVALSNCPREPPWAFHPAVYTWMRGCSSRVLHSLRDVDLARLAERAGGLLVNLRLKDFHDTDPRDYHFPQGRNIQAVTAECVQQILVSNPRLQSLHLRCGTLDVSKLTLPAGFSRQPIIHHDAVRVPRAAGYGRFDSRRSLRSHAVRVAQACRGSPAASEQSPCSPQDAI